MHRLTRSCVLFLWIHTLTFVKSQECTLEDFLIGSMYDENFDTSTLRDVYRSGQHVRVHCTFGYIGSFKMICFNGRWVYRGTRCQPFPGICRPPPEVANAVVVSSQQEKYLPGSHVTYHCHDNYTMEGGNTLLCNNGTWEKNFMCTFLGGCAAPPFLEDGDVKYTIKSYYSHDERVEYQCQAYYTMEGEPFRTCISGEWTGYMRCIKPCVADEDDFRKHNVTLKSRDKRYFKHDEVMEFRCARGRPVGAVAMRQRCSSGVIHLPTCQ